MNFRASCGGGSSYSPRRESNATVPISEAIKQTKTKQNHKNFKFLSVLGCYFSLSCTVHFASYEAQPPPPLFQQTHTL